MTDQLREQIAWAIHDNHGKMPLNEQATRILAIIWTLGYRKMPSGEPPVLSDKELNKHNRYGDSIESEDDWDIRAIVEAQRADDIAFYTGKKPDLRRVAINKEM